MDPAHERNTTLALLQESAARLGTSLNPQLIPPGGIAFGFAIRGARDAGGVAVAIIAMGDSGKPVAGPGTFGSDAPVARIILTAMKFDPLMKSAATLRFSERTADVLENDLLLECADPDPASAGRGISTMDWGIASCCRDGVPDAIVYRTVNIKESRIVIFGETAADVANNIIICSNRI